MSSELRREEVDPRRLLAKEPGERSEAARSAVPQRSERASAGSPVGRSGRSWPGARSAHEKGPGERRSATGIADTIAHTGPKIEFDGRTFGRQRTAARM